MPDGVPVIRLGGNMHAIQASFLSAALLCHKTELSSSQPPACEAQGKQVLKNLDNDSGASSCLSIVEQCQVKAGNTQDVGTALNRTHR